MRYIGKLASRELVMYGIVGLATTALNVGLFEAFLAVGMDYRPANMIAIIVTIISAYFSNKAFVFCTRFGSLRDFLGEAARFMLTRLGTMAVEWFGLIALVDFFGVPKTVGKLAVTVVVVILNYVAGKVCVFRPRISNTKE